MFISVGIIAYNEEGSLDSLFADLRAQTYPHQQIEILLVDGGSTDRTREKMVRFAQDHDFYRVQVLDNPQKKQAPGWNVVLKNFEGDAILRVDAHASIDPRFVEENAACLERGEMVCGGVRPCRIESPTRWKRTLLCAESSLFGSSIAGYRRNGEGRYVSSLFHGGYRAEVIEAVGGFNEMLGRTEDNEFHYRIRQAGYKIWLSPDIHSYQFARPTLKGMIKQKYGNGYWIGLTLGVCPGCLSLFHFVPFVFVLGILGSSLAAILGFPWLFALLWGAYGFCSIAMSVAAAWGEEQKSGFLFLLPLLFLLLHLSYGAGTLIGLLKLPAFKRRYKTPDCIEAVREVRRKRRNDGGVY